MALPTAYLITTKNLEAFLNAIKTAKAPERVNNKFLATLEFTSSNDRLLIGILKALGFIDDSGVPTKRYFDFLDQSRSGAVLAEAVREAYSDLFAINTKAQELQPDDVKNKFRTLTQGQNSDNVLGLMAKTFKALTELADWNTQPNEQEPKREELRDKAEEHREEEKTSEKYWPDLRKVLDNLPPASVAKPAPPSAEALVLELFEYVRAEPDGSFVSEVNLVTALDPIELRAFLKSIEAMDGVSWVRLDNLDLV